MIEGMKVAYAGDTDPFNEVGSCGKVIAISGTAAHVMWSSGPKTGQVDLVEDHELVPQRAATATAQPDAFGVFAEAEAGLQVRATYDDVGEEGLVNSLSEAGHLAMLGEYVEEALTLMASRIRNDPSLGVVLSQLEADEAESLVERMASISLADRLEEN